MNSSANSMETPNGIFNLNGEWTPKSVGSNWELTRTLEPLAAFKDRMRKFIVPDDLGTPPGAVTLRGATNFQTPQGWDTVYTPVFNAIERPAPPMLIVRVETDWYMHETEFRYVLQPGEGISGQRTMPIGQVFFAPREVITLRECTEDELTAMKHADEEFSRGKAANQVTTPYGIPYSPHYLKESRARQKDPKE